MHKGTIVVTNLPYELLIAVVRDALIECGVGNLEVDVHAMSITGETGATWASFGQDLAAQIESIDDKFAVYFASAAHSQLIDWGRGKSEEQEFARAVQRRILSLRR